MDVIEQNKAVKFPSKYQFFEWAFWNFLGVRIFSLLFGLGSLYAFMSDPLKYPFFSLAKFEPFWFVLILVFNGALTWLATKCVSLFSRLAILIPTLLVLPITTFLSGLTVFEYETPSLEYQMWTQVHLVLPYLLVQLGYVIKVLSKPKS